MDVELAPDLGGAAVASLTPHELYVAPDGDDAAPGTRQAPLASLQRARDLLRGRPAAARTGGGGITIWVRGGDYLLPGGLHFGAEDGGTPEAPVTWRAWPGERVRLVGGVQVARFEPWRGEILQAERDRYELRADSPAFALGFAPIPVDRIRLVVDEHRRVVPARLARERWELLFARTLLPLPRAVSHGTETALQLQALRERRDGKVAPDV